MHTDKIEFLGVGFHRLTMHEVLDRLSRVTCETPYSYVVTPNVDHVVRLNSSNVDSTLKSAYANAALSVCDSRVLKQLARLHGLDLPLVPGSDLTTRVFREVIRPSDKVAVIGGADTLVQALRELFPEVEFAHHAPPMGLLHNAAAMTDAEDFIASTGARFTFVAVGSPQQEMIASAVYGREGAVGTALCVGASLDFVTKLQRRAPRFLQLLGLEWAYRLLRDPKRMWRRYLVEGPRVFILAARYRGPAVGS